MGILKSTENNLKLDKYPLYQISVINDFDF